MIGRLRRARAHRRYRDLHLRVLASEELRRAGRFGEYAEVAGALAEELRALFEAMPAALDEFLVLRVLRVEALIRDGQVDRALAEADKLRSIIVRSFEDPLRDRWLFNLKTRISYARRGEDTPHLEHP